MLKCACQKIVVVPLFLFLLTPCAFAESSLPGEEMELSAADLKRMSVFVSNFTELRMPDFDTAQLAAQNPPALLIYFGIEHNQINNSSKILSCPDKNCGGGFGGQLILEWRYVAESIKKYFDVSLAGCADVTVLEHSYRYDGKYCHFSVADTVAYYAKVTKAFKTPDGRIVMRGEIYHSYNESEITGTFEVLAKPHKYNGKDTWAILAFKTSELR